MAPASFNLKAQTHGERTSAHSRVATSLTRRLRSCSLLLQLPLLCIPLLLSPFSIGPPLMSDYFRLVWPSRAPVAHLCAAANLQQRWAGLVFVHCAYYQLLSG
eukprot:SAG11_NODE_7399_length_1149_cov_3.400000_2_plen_103_part_00